MEKLTKEQIMKMTLREKVSHFLSEGLNCEEIAKEIYNNPTISQRQYMRELRGKLKKNYYDSKEIE